MGGATHILAPLETGQRLELEEFLRRWEAMPNLKRAELLGGEVFLASSVSIPRDAVDTWARYWLTIFCLATPGTSSGGNATWLMFGESPQPDAHLFILPEHGGQSRVDGIYYSGAPELTLEVSLSTTSRDQRLKFDLYRRAGVQEYIQVLPEQNRVHWLRLVEGNYQALEPDADGLLRSRVFPGLWLYSAAGLSLDRRRLLDLVQQSTATDEHQAFVNLLASRRP